MLFNIIEELLNPILSKNVGDWLNLNKKTLYDFNFINLRRKTAPKEIIDKDLSNLINILVYFNFLEENKKLFLSKLYFVQICTSLTFFTPTFGVCANLPPNYKTFLKYKLLESIEKLFIAILISKKLKELKKVIRFWNNQYLKLLTSEIFSQTTQEIIIKKFIKTSNYNHNKSHSEQNLIEPNRLYHLKKRFRCFFPFLFGQKFYSIVGQCINTNSAKQNFNFSIIFQAKKLLIKKMLNIFFDIIEFYFFDKKFFFFVKLFNLFKLYNKKSIRTKKNLVIKKKTSDEALFTEINKLEEINFLKSCFVFIMQKVYKGKGQPKIKIICSLNNNILINNFLIK